ncbi:unnamed protein product [Urochloa humidicola]
MCRYRQATDDNFRAVLANGRLLCSRRLFPGALLAVAASDNLGRFHAAVERMGVPTFSAYDLERVIIDYTSPHQCHDIEFVSFSIAIHPPPPSRRARVFYVTCILALKDRFASRPGEDNRNSSFLTRSDNEGGQRNAEAKLQSVFQSRQGHSDLPGRKSSDLMKCSRFVLAAPATSALPVVGTQSQGHRRRRPATQCSTRPRSV